MRRAAAVVLALVLVPAVGSGCKKKEQRAEPAPAPLPDNPPAKATPPDLSFIVGDILIGETRDDLMRPLRLDPSKGAWAPIGSGDKNLFPTGLRLRGGVLCIATAGTTEADHVEQLAIVRGDAVEPFGPSASKIRNPAVAPDGTVVFESDAASFRDLYAIGADNQPVRLTDNEQGNFEPALSPDGKTLVFASSRDGNAELYAMTLADKQQRRLTESPRDDWGAAWSPDGKTLAFLSDRDGAPRLYRMAPDGGAATRMTTEAAEKAVEDQPRWSPDGTTLAFLRGEGPALSVELVDVATGKVRSLTPAGASDLDFAWSPTGSHLAIIRHPDRKPTTSATITFVRVSDGLPIATDDTDGTQVRWVKP